MNESASTELNKSAPKFCHQCAAPLPENAPGGLCPRCLMAQIVEPTLAESDVARRPSPTPEELAPHFPQLEILECLGRGGMGVVYKARQKSLNRLVALKLLAPERADDPQFAARFEKEAHALATLNHPNIVGVHDFGKAGGYFYLLMEFVDGLNLRQLMQSKRLTPDEALRIVPPVCQALQCAHDHGIVHRDIKPENLLIDKAGVVKIADFGIAKMVANNTARTSGVEHGGPADPVQENQVTMALGTPDYAAPEQREGARDVDHRADIYSLGVVLYEMLTGERPKEKLDAPSKRVQVDVRIDEIVLRALEKTPELRYQTAVEFRTQVEAATAPQNETLKSAPAALSLPENSSLLTSAATPRFSRTAIVGAFWAPFFFIAFLMYFTSSSKVVRVSSGDSRGRASATVMDMTSPSSGVRMTDITPHEKDDTPPFLPKLMLLTLAGQGLTAPFGTTILGWSAVGQIRRSAGMIYGMWLAVFDGLLFPLLLMIGLIGWFWGWVFNDLIRASIIQGRPPLSTFERILVNNSTAFTVVATIVTSLILGITIIRRVWRAVNASSSSRGHEALKSAPATQSAPEDSSLLTSAATNENSTLGKWAFALFLLGTLGSLLLLALLPARGDFVAAFGVASVALAFVLGLMSWRERFGKIVVIGTVVLLLIAGVLLVARYNIGKATAKHMDQQMRREQTEAMERVRNTQKHLKDADTSVRQPSNQGPPSETGR